MTHDKDELTGLLPYATEAQARHIEAIIAHGSQRTAAKALGVNARTIAAALAAVRRKAARCGPPDVPYPEAEDIAPPEGSRFYSVNTHYVYPKDSLIRERWVKLAADDARRERLMREAAAAFAEEIPRSVIVRPPAAGLDDLVTQYTLTDYHVGMLAWHEETGADWDVKIAEELLVNWFGAAIGATPAASVGILAQLGDFLHIDNLEGLTPASKHVLDADTRLQKIVRVAIRAIRRVIAMLLTKHPTVHIVMADANHDPGGSIWLREGLAAHFEDEPRVYVDPGADGYYCYEHGLASLFYHHGHRRKPENVAEVFVAKFREVFGRTKYSYGHMGHMHSKKLIESGLMIVEQHPTLASPDAYASRGGWMSKRSASAITYHKQYGEVGRIVLTPEMVSK